MVIFMTSIEPQVPIFEDFFKDNRHGWTLQDSLEFTAKIESNGYLLEHKRATGSNSLVWNVANIHDFYEESTFCIRAVLKNTTPPNPINPRHENHFGIVWQLLDEKNYFEFVISSTGHYRITKTHDNIYYEIVPWRYCRSIRPLGLNILEVMKDDDFLEFYIDGLLVDQLSFDKSLLGKQFGFVLYNKTVVKVHSLTITASSNRTNESTGITKTETTFIEKSSGSDSLAGVFDDINSLIGLEQIKQQLISLANFLKVQSERKKRGLKSANTTLHLVLCGPPGTGKTTIARLIGRLYKQLGLLKSGHVVETDRAGLVSGYIGQTALRVDDVIREALGGVLFIDEAYALAPEGVSSNDFGKEAVQVLLKRMEDHRDNLAVVVAGYASEMKHFIQANPGLDSRFTRQFYLNHYTPMELVSIFKKFCDEHGYSIALPAYITLQAIFESAYRKRDESFGNARFARTIFERSIENQANRIENYLLEANDFLLSQITVVDLKDLLKED
jgi:AAA+ superfamily predicted ATPase